MWDKSISWRPSWPRKLLSTSDVMLFFDKSVYSVFKLQLEPNWKIFLHCLPIPNLPNILKLCTPQNECFPSDWTFDSVMRRTSSFLNGPKIELIVMKLRGPEMIRTATFGSNDLIGTDFRPPVGWNMEFFSSTIFWDKLLWIRTSVANCLNAPSDIDIADAFLWTRLQTTC